MHHPLTASRVRLGRAAAIGALSGALMLAIAPSGQAGTSPSEITAVQCPQVCIAVYDPVTCRMSDRSVRTFSNRCYAEIYACQRRLTIISCQRALD